MGLETEPQTALEITAEIFLLGTQYLTTQEIQARWRLVLPMSDCLQTGSVLTATSLP